MISPSDVPRPDDADSAESQDIQAPFCVLLARYGRVPQVARFEVTEAQFEQYSASLQRGTDLVVTSDRGTELATLLEVVRDALTSEPQRVTGPVLRIAADEDVQQHNANQRDADIDFIEWQQKLDEWQLQLQLVDLEQTLDRQQTILYVLNGQDAETTRLALLAAAAGMGIIHVQPVSAEGIVQQSAGGGCGSGGCGSGGCGSGAH